MMEILCSEMNRMDKNCPAALNLGAARTCVRGKRMAVRPRYGGNRLRLSVSRALLGLQGLRISYQLQSTFRAFNQPKKGQAQLSGRTARSGSAATSERADQL
jgi:hypothetical protein